MIADIRLAIKVIRIKISKTVSDSPIVSRRVHYKPGEKEMCSKRF